MRDFGALHPWWVTGFSDGEACFHASLSKCGARQALNQYFSIGLRADDAAVLRQLQMFFAVGRFRWVGPQGRAKPQALLKVTRREDLDCIRDHFQAFPLRSKKARDSALWGRVLDFRQAHLDGRKDWQRSDRLLELGLLCSELSRLKRYVSNPSSYVATAGLDPWWVTGLADGEGSFTADLHVRSRSSYQCVCGCIVRKGVRNGNPQLRFVINRVEDLLGRVVPHFRNHPLQTKKSRDFELWVQLIEFASCELLGTKGWLRHHPDKVFALKQRCTELSAVRAFVEVA